MPEVANMPSHRSAHDSERNNECHTAKRARNAGERVARNIALLPGPEKEREGKFRERVSRKGKHTHRHTIPNRGAVVLPRGVNELRGKAEGKNNLPFPAGAHQTRARSVSPDVLLRCFFK